MISIVPVSQSCSVSMSFPPSKVVVRNIWGFWSGKSVNICINKPDLFHWVLVLLSETEISEFAELSKQSYKFVSCLMFLTYTIITVGSQGALRRKLSSRGVYDRSYLDDRLCNVDWTSSMICVNVFDEIVSLTSPIQLFGYYKGYDILPIWISAFRSVLESGYLEVRLSFYFFSLGSACN